VRDAVAVFIHGLFSSSQTWDPLVKLLSGEEEITRSFDLKTFEYDSPKWRFNPTRRIPDFPLIARFLKTFLEDSCAEYQTVVLIAHSQGGLVVQRYLREMLDDGLGRDLARIPRIILLACPNNGAEFGLIFRRLVGWLWFHPQERSLRPYKDDVADTNRRIMNRVVHATMISSDSCPIDFRVYAGQSDNIVTPASAGGTFPKYGALRGDHNSILQANSTDHPTYLAIKANLLQVARGSNRPRFARKSSPPALSGDGTLDDATPLLKIKSQFGATSSETEIFDQSLADQYIRQFLKPGEGASS
jgi:pimeloyl-ACP methyl ester carboxylesterase